MAKANVLAKVVKRPSGKRIWNTWSWKCHALPCLLKPDKMHPWIVVYISHEQMRRNMNMKINPTRCSDPTTYSHVLSPPELWKSILSPTASCGNRSWKAKVPRLGTERCGEEVEGLGSQLYSQVTLLFYFGFTCSSSPWFSQFSPSFLYMRCMAGPGGSQGKGKGKAKGKVKGKFAKRKKLKKEAQDHHSEVLDLFI